MSLKRVGILLGKKLWQGPQSVIFIWVIVVPIILSLVVSLIFGTLFTEKPKLGIIDEGSWPDIATKVFGSSHFSVGSVG